MTARGNRVSFWMMKKFWNPTVVMIAQRCAWMENHQIVHFERENLMACELYLNEQQTDSQN